MTRLAKISLVVLTTVMIGISSANFAMAQKKTLVLQDFIDGHASPQACALFRDKVVEVTANAFKAHWYEVQVGGVPIIPGIPYRIFGDTIGGCRIVPAHAADSPYEGNENVRIGNSTASFQSGKHLEAALRANKTLTEDDISSAKFTAEQEKNESSDFSKAVGWFIALIFSLISSILGLIASFAGKLMVAVIGLTTSGIMPNIVEVGWSIIRDFANMFFILVMIVIGLAAILRLEQYDYRHLLGEVILMAILVNFSKVIAETIFNFSNFLVALFAVDSFMEIMSFLLQVSIGGLDDGISSGWTVAFIQGVTKMAFMVVTCGTFLIMAGMFTVRLVGIYVLIILSPMAYILDILPATKDMAHKWWHSFIHYVVWAPVAMFMLRLCMLIVEDGGLSVISKQAGSPMLGLSNDSIFNYVVLIGFMIAAIIVAEHAGMVGGNAVVHGVEHLGHWAGHTAGGYLGRKWNEKTAHLLEQHGDEQVSTRKKVLFTMLNPVAAFKGSQQRAHELSHMAEELATAGGREVVEQFVTGGWKGKTPNLQIPYRQFAERKDEDNFLKEYGNMKKESIMQAAFDLKDMGGAEGAARKRAIIKAAASNGYLDDILRMKHFAQKHGDADGTIYSAEVLNRFLFDYLGDNEQSKRFMAEDMEELGRKTKHFEYMGHAYYDTEKKVFKRGMEEGELVDGLKGADGKVAKVRKLTNTWQADYAASEFGKQGGRDRVAAAPHNITTIRAELDVDGNIITDVDENDGTIKSGKTGSNQISHAVFGRKDGKMDTYTTKILSKMDADVMREIQHTQERVKHWILSKDKADADGTIMVESEEALKQIEEMYKVNPEFVLGLYTKALGVKGDQWQDLGGIKIRVKNKKVVDGKVRTLEGPDSKVRNIGTPKFENIEQLRAGKKKEGVSTPATPPPAREEDSDSSDNPVADEPAS